MAPPRKQDSLPPAPTPRKKKRQGHQPQPKSQSLTPLQLVFCCGGLLGVGLLLAGIVMISRQFSNPVDPAKANGQAAEQPVASLDNQALLSAVLQVVQADYQGETQRPDKLALEAPEPKSRHKIPFRYNAIDTQYEIDNRGSVISKKGLTGFVYVTPQSQPCYIDYERVTAVLRPDAFQGGGFTNAVVDPWTRQTHEVRFDQLPIEEEKVPGVITFAPAKADSDRKRGSYYHVSRVRRLLGDHPPVDSAFPTTLDGLTAKLDSPDFYERMQAVVGIGKLGAEGTPAAEKVAGLLSIPYFRPYALQTLVETKAPPELTLKTYLPLLKPHGVKPQERQVALGGLAALGPAAIPAIPELLALLRENTDREHVLAAFRAMGEPGVAPLLSQARVSFGGLAAVQPSTNNRRLSFGQFDPQVFVALGAIGEPAVEPALKALDEALTEGKKLPDQMQPEPPIDALAALGRSAPGSVAPTIALLRKHGVGWTVFNQHRFNQLHEYARQTGRNGSVFLAAELLSAERRDRQSAAEALEQLGPDAAPAIDAMLEFVRDHRDDFNWRRVVEMLLAFGPQAAPAVPALAEALADRQPYTRRYAAEALQKLGPAAVPAVPRLAAALSDDEYEVVRAAANTLAALGTQNVSAREALREGLSKAKPFPLQFVLEAVQTLGPAAQFAVPDIIASHQRSEIAEVRAAARAALLKIDPEAVKQLE